MNSIIVWTLTIQLSTFAAAPAVMTSYDTEAQCESARATLAVSGARLVSGSCIPAKRPERTK